MLFTIVVFALTLILVMLRPKRVTEWMAAALGGLLMLIGGRVGLDEAAHTLAASWNVFGFFLGLMSISALADAAGFFEWAAFTAARHSGGSARRLFINVFLVGTVVTTFLSNDATALILTPIVFTLVSRLGLSPLPYFYACIFVADTASLTLPVSNPVNILMVDATNQGLADYLSYLLLPSILAISLNLVLFLFIFRNAISVPRCRKAAASKAGGTKCRLFSLCRHQSRYHRHRVYARIPVARASVGRSQRWCAPATCRWTGKSSGQPGLAR